MNDGHKCERTGHVPATRLRLLKDAARVHIARVSKGTRVTVVASPSCVLTLSRGSDAFVNGTLVLIITVHDGLVDLAGPVALPTYVDPCDGCDLEEYNECEITVKIRNGEKQQHLDAPLHLFPSSQDIGVCTHISPGGFVGSHVSMVHFGGWR